MDKLQINTDENISLEEKNLRFEKYKYNIELLKWFIGSVALVLITLIIDNGFKERTAGVQEMKAYDNYVEIILKADNIEDRWKLAQYFSNVTPTERLRERWIAYKDSISKDYKTFMALKEKEKQLRIQQKDTTLSKARQLNFDTELNKIQNQLAPFEKKLINSKDNNTALFWEEKGFSFLLSKDITAAINAFKNSENAYNQFHQVYEISKYLEQNKTQLLEPENPFWKTAFKKIATDYSWKMPLEIRNNLIMNSK